MPERRSPLPILSDTELRLLRIFQAVVRQQGFAAAQAETGIAPATISNHIARLEARLGVRLCNRGRKGFSLTAEGARIHEASLNLFRSVENFTSIVGSVRGELTGTVHFATVDAIYTNRALAFDEALRSFATRAPGVQLLIDIASPHDLRQRLLDGRYQLILTPLEDTHPSILSEALFDEEQSLYCGRAHELYDVTPRQLASRLKRPTRYAARSYAASPSLIGAFNFEIAAMTSHMESLALLILSGSYIGHLPTHYAKGWVDAGHMRKLLPATASYADRFHLAHLRDEQNRAASVLRDSIRASAERASGR